MQLKASLLAYIKRFYLRGIELPQKKHPGAYVKLPFIENSISSVVSTILTDNQKPLTGFCKSILKFGKVPKVFFPNVNYLLSIFAITFI